MRGIGTGVGRGSAQHWQREAGAELAHTRKRQNRANERARSSPGGEPGDPVQRNLGWPLARDVLLPGEHRNTALGRALDDPGCVTAPTLSGSRIVISLDLL
jgi:hypothetical protein